MFLAEPQRSQRDQILMGYAQDLKKDPLFLSTDMTIKAIKFDSSSTSHWIQVCLLIASFGYLYAQTVTKLIHDWNTDDNFSHGFLIPVIIGLHDLAEKGCSYKKSHQTHAVRYPDSGRGHGHAHRREYRCRVVHHAVFHYFLSVGDLHIPFRFFNRNCGACSHSLLVFS